MSEDIFKLTTNGVNIKVDDQGFVTSISKENSNGNKLTGSAENHMTKIDKCLLLSALHNNPVVIFYRTGHTAPKSQWSYDEHYGMTKQSLKDCEFIAENLYKLNNFKPLISPSGLQAFWIAGFIERGHFDGLFGEE